MHVALAPGESLPDATATAARAALERPGVEAVLMPLRPVGPGALPRAAARYLAAWDRRFVHRQTFFAPASRCAARAPLPGWRNADAAPVLADAIARGAVVEALPGSPVDTPIGRDLDAWRAWAREEGEAWGALAAREPRFLPFLPASTRPGWWRHNVAGAPSRIVEIGEAVGRVDPGVAVLHLLREAAWTGGCVAGLRAFRRTPMPF